MLGEEKHGRVEQDGGGFSAEKLEHKELARATQEGDRPDEKRADVVYYLFPTTTNPTKYQR